MTGLLILIATIVLIFLFAEISKSRKEVSLFRRETNQKFESLQKVILSWSAPTEASESEVQPPEPEVVIEKLEQVPPPLPPGPVLEEPQYMAAAQPQKATQVVAPKEPGAFESSVKTVLAKIWSWIVVGEDHRPTGVTMEFAVATTWLLRIGLLILVLGIGFFLQYRGADDVMSAQVRVAIGVVTGIAMMIAGVVLHRGKYRLMGHGFCGGAAAILYTSFLVAHTMAGLNALAAFGLMVLVTVVAGLLAVKLNSQLIAFLGLIGGYGTPVLLGAEAGTTTVLFSYLILLGLGVFWVASNKEWRFLYYSAFVATYSLFGLQLMEYQPELLMGYLPFLIGFFILFSTVTFIHQVMNGEKSTLLEILFLFLNSAVFFGFARYLMLEGFAKEFLAIVTLSLAAFYIFHIVVFLRRKLHDRPLLLSFIGLATVFVAITLPILLTAGWVTVSWAIQGFVMLWIASKLRSNFLKVLAYALYAIVMGRLLLLETGNQFFDGAPDVTLAALLNRLSLFGIPILSLFAAHRLLKIPGQSNARNVVDRENDIPLAVSSSFSSSVLFWCTVAIGFLYLNFEFWLTVGRVMDAFMLPSLTLVWVGLALVAFWQWRKTEQPWVFGLFVIVTLFTTLKLVGYDLIMFATNGILSDTALINGFAPRLVNFGSVLMFFIAMWLLFGRMADQKAARSVFGYSSIALAFIYTTLEVATYSNEFWPRFVGGSLSIYWALFGLTLLLFGILRGLKGLRGISLVLLAIVVAKVFFHDLNHFEPIFRILAFIVLGILVLVGSFLYIRFQSHFEMSDSE